jgi:hypothetical protein
MSPPVSFVMLQSLNEIAREAKDHLDNYLDVSWTRQPIKEAFRFPWLRVRFSSRIESMRLGYLWPFGEYRDARSGSELERAAAFRHNKRLAKRLPIYLSRWSAISAVLLTASMLCPASLAPALGTAFTLAFCMIVHIAHVYLLFIRN